MEEMIKGINKFMYYTWNYGVEAVYYHGERTYVPGVIVHADWHCNLDHMVEKWLAACDRSEKRHESPFSIFYADLDGTNRRAMLSWIVDNYNDEIKL